MARSVTYFWLPSWSVTKASPWQVWNNNCLMGVCETPVTSLPRILQQSPAWPVAWLGMQGTKLRTEIDWLVEAYLYTKLPASRRGRRKNVRGFFAQWQFYIPQPALGAPGDPLPRPLARLCEEGLKHSFHKMGRETFECGWRIETCEWDWIDFAAQNQFPPAQRGGRPWVEYFTLLRRGNTEARIDIERDQFALSDEVRGEPYVIIPAALGSLRAGFHSQAAFGDLPVAGLVRPPEVTQTRFILYPPSRWLGRDLLPLLLPPGLLPTLGNAKLLAALLDQVVACLDDQVRNHGDFVLSRTVSRVSAHLARSWLDRVAGWLRSLESADPDEVLAQAILM